MTKKINTFTQEEIQSLIDIMALYDPLLNDAAKFFSILKKFELSEGSAVLIDQWLDSYRSVQANLEIHTNDETIH